jgi:hypothetical protein
VPDEINTAPVDWRSTPITPGALVIYGGPAGRSITMVEARVADPMLSLSGRIWLDIVRRSYAHTDGGRVHVGADRLTVVTELPPTTVPTDAERAARERAKRDAREVFADGLHEREGHDGDPPGRVSTGPADWQYTWRTCQPCSDAIARWNAAWEAQR